MKISFSIIKIVKMAMLTSIAIFLHSCQKELTGVTFTFGCKITHWADLDSAGNATESFDYIYDSVTGKPILLQYTEVGGTGAQTVLPVFSRDTVYFNPGSYAILDNSKRIVQLEEQNAASQAVANGSYFYTYDAGGHLATRVYDDGSTNAITTYTFSGDELSKIDEPALGMPNALTTSFNYAATTTVKDYNAYVLATDFPELRLYLPCFTFGKFTDKAIEKKVLKVNIPLFPIPEITTAFTNYQFDAKGQIIKVQVTDSVGGSLVNKGFVAGGYLCR